MFIVMVDGNGDFSVDVFDFMVDGNFDVIVMVIDVVGNIVIDIVSGDINFVVFILFLDFFGLGNDMMLIILGNIDLVLGSIVMLIVIDSVGNI